MLPRDSLPRRRAMLLLAFCATCWSIAGVLTRRLEHTASLDVTFWRSFFCALTMLVLLSARRGGNPLAAMARMGRAGLVSGAMWGTMFTCFMIALTMTSVANALVVSSVAPLLTALLGRIVLGTRLGAFDWIATLAAGAGIAWMMRDGVDGEGGIGMAIALCVPLASSVQFVVLKRLQAQIDLAPAVLLGALLSCAATLALAWPMRFPADDLPILMVLGSVQLAIPCFLLVRAVGPLAPHEVALIALLEVVLGPIWAWLWAGEAVSAATLQGGLVVLGALVVNALFGRSAAAPTTRTAVA
ncbi:MAG: DMT family transporter [Burkholderiaceae bacterium]|nr:DMT family transporter [Burkholderiaceae bacterium]